VPLIRRNLTLRHVSKSHWNLGIALVFAALMSAIPASAQPAALKGNGACRVDAATHCKGIEAGGGRRMQCLSANRDKLSPECASVVDARIASKADRQANAAAGPKTAQTAAPLPGMPGPSTTTPATGQPPAGATGPVLPVEIPKGAQPAGGADARPMAACRQEMKALCGAVTAGGGARRRCLVENQAKLSPACSAALTARQDVQADGRIACKADAQRLCGLSKGPDRRACLQQNLAQLSPDCSAALAKR
jgi:hypothetical protein